MTNTTSTPAARRRALRDLIEQAATEERFDMDHWAYTPDRVATEPSDAAQCHTADPCGTVACAAGWAVTLMTPDELREVENCGDSEHQAAYVADWLDIPVDAFHTPDWAYVPGPLSDASEQADDQHRDLTPEEQAAAFCNYLDSLD